jgi:RES domain-containing protein
VTRTWVRVTASRLVGVGGPLWTGGYRVRHNRYVRRNAFPAYHVSEGTTTAFAEVFGTPPGPSPRVGVPPENQTTLVIEVDLPDVLDLAVEAVRGHIGVSHAEIVRLPNWAATDFLGRPAEYELTQCIGELAMLAGCGGVLYPAARDTDGVNLVVFTDRLAAVGGSIRAIHPVTNAEHRLP